MGGRAFLMVVGVGTDKPRTAKVGVISKAQNCERGTLWNFLTSIVLKGDPMVQSKKFQKSHRAEKKVGLRWDP